MKAKMRIPFLVGIKKRNIFFTDSSFCHHIFDMKFHYPNSIQREETKLKFIPFFTYIFFILVEIQYSQLPPFLLVKGAAARPAAAPFLTAALRFRSTVPSFIAICTSRTSVSSLRQYALPALLSVLYNSARSFRICASRVAQLVAKRTTVCVSSSFSQKLNATCFCSSSIFPSSNMINC